MALNLSTLTSPANSSVLEEVNTTADFLESCPVLRNLSRGSNKGGDAKQDVALNQPKALPLIDGDGYLYLSGVSGNGAVIGQSVLPATGDFDLRINFIYTLNTTSETDIFSQYEVDQTGRFFIAFDNNNKRVKIFWNGFGNIFSPNDSLVVGKRYVLKLTRSGSSVSLHLNDVLQVSHTIANSIPIHQVNSTVGFAYSRTSFHSLGAVFSVTEGSNVNVDFTATNSPRHGDTKFKCATGQVVTVNQSGNDPATIIKKPVLRFDGTNDGLNGLLNQTVTGGYMFAAFSVLGNGGETAARVLGINSTGANDNDATGAIFSLKGGTSDDLRSIVAENYQTQHIDLYNSQRGDILHERKISNGAQLGKVNNADAESDSVSTTISAEEFALGFMHTGNSNRAAIDLEYLALFPATITDDQADSVRNFINNRNNVFDLKDGFGYYFYDAQKAPVGAISSGSSAWNGRIVGSDNGDTDKLATQGTGNDQPVSDGYVVTFTGNSDHLEIPSTTQAGWQIVGTSLGTFAYRVNNTAVTELNLLGNLGNATYRAPGDLYGIILLPESATGADIEQARKLLIDRGASDAAYAGSLFAAWYNRSDIVNFKHVNTSSVTVAHFAWYSCNNLTEFPALDLSNSIRFESAWQSCSALTSFPAGAKLGTSASNVNFTDAWRDSGLTSFPALDLSTGANFTRSWFYTPLVSFGAIDASNTINFSNAWQGTGALTSFPAAAKLGTSATNVNFTNAWRQSGITSFSTPLTTTNRIVDGFNSCTSLTDFSDDVFANWNPQDIASGVFHDTWKGCTSLTAVSVGNILQSIDESGQHGTDDGTSTGNPLGNAGIDIDYNGDPLSAATNTAVTSLKAKGWSIIVNNVTL